MQIKIDEKLVNYIEALQYEKDRTNEIVAFMLSHDYDTKTASFKQWDKDNQNAYIKYNVAKSEIEDKYIHSNPKFKNKKVDWSLDFNSKILTIKEDAVDAEKD